VRDQLGSLFTHRTVRAPVSGSPFDTRRYA
jgi:hypothetical protein